MVNIAPTREKAPTDDKAPVGGAGRKLWQLTPKRRRLLAAGALLVAEAIVQLAVKSGESPARSVGIAANTAPTPEKKPADDEAPAGSADRKVWQLTPKQKGLLAAAEALPGVANAIAQLAVKSGESPARSVWVAAATLALGVPALVMVTRFIERRKPEIRINIFLAGLLLLLTVIAGGAAGYAISRPSNPHAAPVRPAPVRPVPPVSAMPSAGSPSRGASIPPASASATPVRPVPRVSVTPSAGSPSRVSPTSSASPTPTSPGPSPLPGPHTEITDNHSGTPVFSDPQGSAVAHVKPIHYHTRVSVKCRVSNGSSTTKALYLLNTAPWIGLYAPSYDFVNADSAGHPGSAAIDRAVPRCRS